MAEVSEPSEYEECVTQRYLGPTMAEPPQSEQESSSEYDGIVIGLGERIPRWDVTQQPNRKLQYFVRKDTFPPDGIYLKNATTAFKQAADEWNNVNF